MFSVLTYFNSPAMLACKQTEVNGGASSLWIKTTVTFTFLQLLQRAVFILKELKSTWSRNKFSLIIISVVDETSVND